MAQGVEGLPGKNRPSVQIPLLPKRPKTNFILVLVAHTCNPSYSRGTDQEDHHLKAAQAKIREILFQKYPT
jgi:hypothetical protein